MSRLHLRWLPPLTLPRMPSPSTSPRAAQLMEILKNKFSEKLKTLTLARLRAIRGRILIFLGVVVFLYYLRLRSQWRILYEEDGIRIRLQDLPSHSSIVFQPGTLKAVGHRYTKTIVIPHTRKEDIRWAYDAFGQDPEITISPYQVNGFKATMPKNKGNEVMAYLTYIIQHYDAPINSPAGFSDINIFIHGQSTAWHNDDFLNRSTSTMLARLSASHVQKQGYVDLRCDWSPGCPEWIHINNDPPEEKGKPEQASVSPAWRQLFPHDPVPNILAHPCCSQFAVSAERLHAIPRVRYVAYRAWLLGTNLSNSVSGRVWEHLWQWVFLGETVWCPAPHECLCRVYGICWGDAEAYEKFRELWADRGHAKDELRKLTKEKGGNGKGEEKVEAGIVEDVARNVTKWVGEVERLNRVIGESLEEAIARGRVEAETQEKTHFEGITD